MLKLWIIVAVAVAQTAAMKLNSQVVTTHMAVTKHDDVIAADGESGSDSSDDEGFLVFTGAPRRSDLEIFASQRSLQVAAENFENENDAPVKFSFLDVADAVHEMETSIALGMLANFEFVWRRVLNLIKKMPQVIREGKRAFVTADEFLVDVQNTAHALAICVMHLYLRATTVRECYASSKDIV